MAQMKSGVSTKIWDIWIRAFHWVLAGCICFMLFSGETGFLFFEWHRKVGEFVLALLLFRLLWGFVGSSNAGLFGLIVNPKRAFSHLNQLVRGDVKQTRGHNAAGGWAVLILLLLITFQAVSGLFIADEDELLEGAFYGAINYDLSVRLLHLHHTNAQVLLILVGIHVFMVFAYLIRAGTNLITPMITGRMNWTASTEPPPVKFTQPLIGLILIVASVGIVGLLVNWFG